VEPAEQRGEVSRPPAGGSTCGLDRLGPNLRLRVSDSGRGISQHFLPYVFDRFPAGGFDLDAQHGGLGIGLTIVRHIIELHGGSVSAESGGEGQGATFTVTLPVSGRRRSAIPEAAAVSATCGASATRRASTRATGRATPAAAAATNGDGRDKGPAGSQSVGLEHRRSSTTSRTRAR
jgi:hypothetical protein